MFRKNITEINIKGGSDGKFVKPHRSLRRCFRGIETQGVSKIRIRMQPQRFCCFQRGDKLRLEQKSSKNSNNFSKQPHAKERAFSRSLENLYLAKKSMVESIWQ